MHNVIWKYLKLTSTLVYQSGNLVLLPSRLHCVPMAPLKWESLKVRYLDFELYALIAFYFFFLLHFKISNIIR